MEKQPLDNTAILRYKINKNIEKDSFMPIRYTAEELQKLIEKDGWEWFATRGSHRQFKHPEKPGKVTIPFHKGALNPKVANSVLKQAGLK